MTDLTKKYMDRLADAQLAEVAEDKRNVAIDRFEHSEWYMCPVGLGTIIYDASDPDGDGPNGHGMVCQDAVLADARLIIRAPTLLRIVRTLLASWECDEDDDAKYEYLMDKAIGMARATIAEIDAEQITYNWWGEDDEL
jgi:hypothetical protein